MKRQAVFGIAKGLKGARRQTKTERCPKCESVMTYYRLKTKDFVCRGCGNVWEKEP